MMAPLFAAALWWTACAPQPEASVSPPVRPPSVLLVVLDTVRADTVSGYGYRHPTTPQLDAVAAAGVTFEDVTAPGSWTWSSHASLFTGLTPWEHGAHISIREEGVDSAEGNWGLKALRPDVDTLAKRFADAGYRTVSLASNRFLDPALGLTRDFETAEVMKDDALAARAEAIIADPSDDRPLFLFVNILIAHAPWEVFPVPWSQRHEPRLKTAEAAPPWSVPYLMESTTGIDMLLTPPGQAMSGIKLLTTGDVVVPAGDRELIEDLYSGGVQAADFLLSKLLKPWTAAHPTGVVAVTSDHGEYLGEHGLWDHGLTVYSQVVDVPLVIAAPGRLPSGKRVSTPVQMHDAYGTLLDLAGLAHPGRTSLVPVVAGEPRPGPIVAKAWASRSWSESIGGRFASDWSLYREGPWALISSSGGERQLFNLKTDRAMERDLSTTHPERLAQMVSKSDASFVEASADAREVELSPHVVEELRALGYLDH